MCDTAARLGGRYDTVEPGIPVDALGAPWAATPRIALNSGLVAIIGARGSGKTALADIIAAGCDAHGDSLPDKAFLIRANEHLAGARVRLDWKAGDAVERQLDQNGARPWDSYPRARYPSPQVAARHMGEAYSDALADRPLQSYGRRG